MSEPAFPQASPEMCHHGQSSVDTQGMTLRDYFAAKASAGILSNQETLNRIERSMKQIGASDFDERLASCAYSVADAMLEARKPQSGLDEKLNPELTGL